MHFPNGCAWRSEYLRDWSLINPVAFCIHLLVLNSRDLKLQTQASFNWMGEEQGCVIQHHSLSQVLQVVLTWNRSLGEPAAKCPKRPNVLKTERGSKFQGLHCPKIQNKNNFVSIVFRQFLRSDIQRTIPWGRRSSWCELPSAWQRQHGLRLNRTRNLFQVSSYIMFHLQNLEHSVAIAINRKQQCRRWFPPNNQISSNSLPTCQVLCCKGTSTKPIGR